LLATTELGIMLEGRTVKALAVRRKARRRARKDFMMGWDGIWIGDG